MFDEMKFAVRHTMTLDDYFGIEAGSPFRHEYWEGEVFAMAGGTVVHARIAANVLTALARALSGGPCFAVGSDLRLALPTGLLTYPDAAVYCGEPAFLPGRTDTVINPTVLVEVLSPSTRSYDLGDKREHYETAPSVRDILLVETERREVVHWARVSDGWDRTVVRSGRVVLAGVVVGGVPVSLGLVEIYAGIEVGGGE